MSDEELRALERLAAREGGAAWTRYQAELARRGLVRLDRHGDPLPPRALARLGTTRLTPGGRAHGVAWTPDGERLLAIGPGILASFDARDGRTLLRTRVERVGPIAVSPDGTRVALGGARELRAHVHAIEDARPIASLGPGGAGDVPALAWSPDGSVLAVALEKQVVLHEVASGAAVVALKGSRSDVSSIAFSPDGERVLVGGDRTPRLHEVKKGKALARLEGHAEKVRRVAWSRDGETFATVDETGKTFLWNAATHERLAESTWAPARGRNPHPTELRILDDAILLGTAEGLVGTFRVLDRATLVERRSFEDVHGGWTVSPDGRAVAAWGGNGVDSIRIRDVATGAATVDPPTHGGAVHSLAIDRAGRSVFTAAWGTGGALWSFEGELIRRFTVRSGHGFVDNPHSAALDPEGTRIAALGSDLAILDAGTGGLLHRRERPHSSIPNRVAWSPDGRTVATGSVGLRSANGELVLWSSSAEERSRVKLGRGTVNDIAFSPDGRRVLACLSGSALVVDVATGTVAFEVSHGDDLGRGLTSLVDVSAGAWHPRESLLATADDQGRLRIRDAATGAVERELVVAPGPLGAAPARGSPTLRIDAVAWSPDGRQLAVAAGDGTVRLLDGATFAEWLVLAGHEPPHVKRIAWFPDGRRLATASLDGTVLTWEVEG